MRTLLNGGLALSVLALALATSPASADVDVTATLNKDRLKTELILHNHEEFYGIMAVGQFELDGAAEAEAVVNAVNTGNSNPPPLPDETFDLDFDATITTSVFGNSGVTGVNQDAGRWVNQGNVVSFGLTDSASSLTDAEAFTDQANLGNILWQAENDVETIDIVDGKPTFVQVTPSRTATIGDADPALDQSASNNLGILGLNQNAGDINNQHNSTALTVGIGSVVALGEAALGQSGSGNFISEVDTVRADTVQNAFNSNQGIAAVNQTTGNLNNQGSVVAFAATTSFVGIGAGTGTPPPVGP